MPLKRLHLALIATSLVLAACAPRMNVYRISEPGSSKKVEHNRKRSGVYYALPRTVVTVAVPMTLKQPIPRENSCMSEVDPKRLSKLGIPTERTLTFGDPTLTTRSEPDPDQMFVVEIRPRVINRMDHTLELTEQGVLTHGSGTGRNQALQLGVEVVKIVASVAVRTGFGLTPSATPTTCSARLAALEGSVEKQSNLRLAIARAAAAGQPTAALESQLANEKNLADLLMGQWFPHETRSASVVCDRRAIEANTRPLFGVVGGKPATAVRIDAGVTSDDCTAPAAFVADASSPVSKTYQLTFAETDHGKTLLAATSAVPKPRCWLWLVSGSRCARGLYYRVPVTVDAMLSTTEVAGQPRQLLDQRVAIAQLGAVASLPPRVGNLFGGKADLELWEATGGLKKLETTEDAAPPNLLTGIDSTAKAWLDANDELARLKRKKEILELEAAIEKLQNGE